MYSEVMKREIEGVELNQQIRSVLLYRAVNINLCFLFDQNAPQTCYRMQLTQLECWG